MAIISGIILTASRMTTPAGKKFHLIYHYDVMWEASDPGDTALFKVFCEIWQGSQAFNSILFGPNYDPHVIRRNTSMPICRIIEIPYEQANRLAGKGLILKLAIKTETPQGEFLYEAATTTELVGEL